jgi:hypothetical protein
MTAKTSTKTKPNEQTQAEPQVDTRGLPTDPDELRDAARDMAKRLERIDADAAAAAEPPVSVRWIRDAQQHTGQIDGRTYTGRGPVYRRRPLPDGQELTELVEPGEVQQIPADAARVLAQAGYVSYVND